MSEQKRIATVTSIEWTPFREYIQLDVICNPFFGNKYERIRIIVEEIHESECVYVFDGENCKNAYVEDIHKNFHDLSGLLETYEFTTNPFLPVTLQEYDIVLSADNIKKKETKEMFDDLCYLFL